MLTAGGQEAIKAAKWSRSAQTWAPIGKNNVTIQSGTVLAIVNYGPHVFLGGVFAFVDVGQTLEEVNSLIYWDGVEQDWFEMGGARKTSGSQGQVQDLAIIGDNLYATGWFASAGTISANGIAAWHIPTGTWHPLGSGLGGGQGFQMGYRLAPRGSLLYTGGDFTTAGGLPSPYLASWNTATSSWSGFGSGLGPENSFTKVCGLALTGNRLFAGGEFLTAGGKPAASMAAWSVAGPIPTPPPDDWPRTYLPLALR